jgi:hypothetical protein
MHIGALDRESTVALVDESPEALARCASETNVY